jgi:hypothetical protein
MPAVTLTLHAVLPVILMALQVDSGATGRQHVSEPTPRVRQAAWLATRPRNATTGRLVLSEAPQIELDDAFLSDAEVHSLDLIASNLGTPWIRGNKQGGMQRPRQLAAGGWFKMFDVPSRMSQAWLAMPRRGQVIQTLLRVFYS